MYICVCKGITDTAIRREVRAGACSFREVRERLGVATQCGKCACAARQVIADAMPQETADTSRFYNPLFTPGLSA